MWLCEYQGGVNPEYQVLMTEYTTFSGSGTRAARRGRATHDPEHAPARSFAGRSERSPVSQVSLGLGDPTHSAPRDSDATEPPDHLRRRAPLVARCPVDGPAAEKSRTRTRSMTRSPYTPPRTEGRTNAFITFPAPKAHSASRTATPCYIVRTLEIAILRLLYTVVCRQLSTTTSH